ncbi:AraC family transcriptional regulator [Streptomyces spiroverticillatus]|uniref:AraC family transcriptional regulator n=1 Tax=Streptomyces finlayi TaxID=67296 RepID=A0A918X5K7_9ACTN|nr:helix-turn-helix domain-containing protein [Streptomyces finlayi]GHA39195.1 AraC family transcriptional regulator [Streptomyces spiroverticillatus]GHD14113.1 AraC family transcriptional regulator [Streptomyces finlayi]
MLEQATPLDWAAVDITVPRATAGLPGVAMAGFGQRVADAPAAVEIAMVAHPSVTLLFDLGGGDGLVCGTEGRYVRGSAAVGLLPGEFRAGGPVGACLQIRLGPVAAAAVLGPAAELVGEVASLADVWGRSAAEQAEERLRAAVSWDARFAAAVGLLGRRAEERRERRPPVDPEVEHTWRRTLAGQGCVRVEALAYETGWSRKRLSARFGSQLGITPKRAARLVRFDRAAHLLAAGRPPADVALGCGYADQPHLHRDVREFVGLTPTALAAAPWLAIDDIAWPGGAAGR